MTSDMPPSPPAPPAAPQRSAPRPSSFWQVLGALAVGFALPVLACYGLILTGALALQVLSLGAARSDFSAARSGSGPAVAVIRVEGVIVSGSAGPFDASGVAASDTIIRSLERARQDPNVKAILLMVNSPGGGVTASDLIYHELKQIDKPVVVLMGDLAASGGYYISMAADWIVANPNTLTGSIGVISEFPNASGLLDKVGVDFVVITSGPRKDLGSPYRDMTDAERAYWQAIVDESYESFVRIVAEGRHLSEDQVRPLADGGVFTGRQALEKGLVDQLGYREDALAKAAELGGITGEPRVIEYRDEPTFLQLLAQTARTPSLLPAWAEVVNLIGVPRLSARWAGP